MLIFCFAFMSTANASMLCCVNFNALSSQTTKDKSPLDAEAESSGTIVCHGQPMMMEDAEDSQGATAANLCDCDVCIQLTLPSSTESVSRQALLIAPPHHEAAIVTLALEPLYIPPQHG
jgi:hypothetical protein